MATATQAVPIEGDQCVEFPGIDWKGYTTMLRLRGEHGVPRMVYLDGSLWLMSPSFPHERDRERLGQFMIHLFFGLGIRFVGAGQTTFRRRARRGGVEGDLTYYLANADRVRGKRKINLQVDPPPDLAIEAVYSHDASKAIEVYRRLRVPEVWVCDEAELKILVRQPNGRYVESEASAAFPFLTAAEVFDWVRRPETETDWEWGTEVRAWIANTLTARLRPRD